MWHVDQETDLLGPRPTEAVQRADYDAAATAVEAWRTARRTEPGNTQENASERLSEASAGAVPRIPQEPSAPETTPAVSPAAAALSWRQRPHGRLNDTELRQALQQTLLAARTAQQEAQNGDKTVEALRAAARPGGLVEQRVDALHDQVRAIAALDMAATEVRALETSHAAAVTERQGLEEALAATGRLGRPALRGTDREHAEQRLRDIGGELERTRRQLTDTATRQARYEALAGDPAARERALARWERLGGTRETVLAQAIQANDRRIRQAEAASEGFRTTSARLRPRIASLRAEQATREAMTPQERREEATERAVRGGLRPIPTTSSPEYRSPGQEPGQER
ncbi:hypothetical protein ACIRD3_37460 [Kitasatospora sp. NPDC093550]|uniref:hypothetical protein n=1 Tax=Kitasatospora sp. NPDC093550 TaxID=3364089 RepID=UPI0038259356